MKFNLKYHDAKPEDVIPDDSLLVSGEEKPCVECGKPTHFIDYCGECPLCSEECSCELWTEISAACAQEEEKL